MTTDLIYLHRAISLYLSHILTILTNIFKFPSTSEDTLKSAVGVMFPLEVNMDTSSPASITPSEADVNMSIPDADPTQQPPSSGSSQAPGPIFTPAPPSDVGETSNSSVSSYSEAESPSPSDIAIIGMSLRVPGQGNTSPDSLWQYLIEKHCAASSIPPERWEPYNSRHPLNKSILSKTTSKGYFLDNLPDFDASFFGISPREAEQMDPQQRLALELAWEALEDAGIAPDKVAISGPENTTSVYMGVNSDDYGKLVLEDLANIGAHMGVGTAYCGVPSRISHNLNLMGPSLAVDAACASSLVAVHMARQAILAGETEVAIVGGVNALIGPGLTRVLDEAGAIASDGVCRSFDDSAHGYGRGEGAGVVVLKKLDKALADGDRVHAVLKGSAVCGDGKTLGIMAPNAAAQRLVARKALKEAKVSAESIGYVEAHATSTPLGDPTEMSALADVYGRISRPEGAPCYVGSIKPNIGHLEAAAGVLGLIKSVLVLKHGVVPGQTNLEKHSTKIDWDSHNLVVPKEPTRIGEWTRPMRAAVASYGYSGTVSHAIVEASPVEETNLVSETDKASEVLLFLSAPQANRLPAAAKALAQYLQTAPESVTLEQVATTLASRRSHHKYRTSVTAGTREEAIAALNKLANSEEDPYVVGINASQHRVSPETANKGVMWIFSGHGAQWPGMGKELMATQPLFAQTIHRLEPIVQRELGFSVVQALSDAREDHSTDENQIMTYAMHIGLATVLIEESGPPAAVVGHSLGETAAAVVSGALSFDEGAILACTRARLYRRVMGTGGMALVSISGAEMRAKLAAREDKGIDVAIEASPTSCVIAGPKEPVMEMVGELMAAGVKLFPLPTDIGFHSRSLQQLAQPLREALEPVLHPKIPTTTRLYSSWTADARSAHPRNAEYWVNNMVQPVLLHGAIKAIAEDGYRAFVEVSSHPIAAYSMSEILEVAGVPDAVVLPSMIRGKPAMKQLLTTVGRLHCLGYPVNYTSKNDHKPWATDVPRTIWSHVPYWREVSQVPKGSQAAAHDPNSNNLLGSKTTISGTKAGHVLFQTTIDETTKPFPGNHPLHGSEIVPAAVLVNTFLHAIDASAYCLEGVSLKVPVVVSPAREIQILLEEGKSLTLTSRLSQSDGNGAWLVNTTSGVAPASVSPRTVDLSEIKARVQSALPSSFSTDYLANVGVPEMGFPWAIEEHFTDNSDDSTEMLALVATNPNDSIKAGLEDLGASIMDAATSIASTIFHKDPLLRMPTSIGKVTLPGGRYPVDFQKGYIHCTRTKMTKTEFIVDVTVLSETGDVVVEFESMAFAGIEPPSKTETRRSENANDLVHRISWLPATPSETPLSFSKVILFSPGEESATVEHSVTMGELTRLFSSRGYTTIQTANANDLATFTKGAEKSIVVHVPRPAQSQSTDDISHAAAKACEGLVSAVQTLSGTGTANTKLFSLIIRSSNPNDSLAFSPLHGLCRIMKSEMPDIFAGLFDLESHDNLPSLPTSLKYIQNADIVRYQDYVPRVARLRPLICPAAKPTIKKTEFSPGGTYLITGGLGALGLQVAKWMVERGARRLVLLSRRALPPRASWSSILADTSAALHEAISTITTLESQGCTIHPLALDITSPTFPSRFTESLTSGILSTLPPITGIIHAAGVLIDQPIPEITTPEFNTVLSPKITGALHLHNLFPVGTPNLEFFTMFSSCGQLLGFPGQGSYASGNAFLDGLAELRRSQGDSGARSILWTSWRDLGMAGGSTNSDVKLTEEEARAKKDYISAELTSRGVGDVTPEEAFAAWDVITSSEGHTDNAESNVVVLRALEVEADEEAAVPILEEIAPRKERAVVAAATGAGAGASGATTESSGAAGGRPASGPELEKYLRETLTTAVANTLGLSAENVDTSVALAEMGMDSVMTVAFRTTVQKKLKVKMAPTLVWKCPTIGHLVTYFMGELSA